MADHGKNRRRSLFARRRQQKGKSKAAKNFKLRSEFLRKCRLYWKGLGPYPRAGVPK